MASFLSLNLLSLLLLVSLSSASRHHKPPPLDDDPSCRVEVQGNIIHEACKASRDPSACETWLSNSSHVPSNATVLQVIQSALRVTTHNLDKGRAMAKDILNTSAGNKNRSTAAKTCLEMVHYSKYRINLTANALSTRGSLKDARAWMSAALVYQYDCWSALKYVNDTSAVVQTMAFFNSTLIAGSSSTLAMMMNYDMFGDRIGSWGPARTERDGFWEPGSGTTGSGSGSVGGVPSGLKVDVTVCKSGCNHKTVQEAVNGAPDNDRSGRRFVIWIRAGVYEETVLVQLEKKNVVLLGDGMGKTVITGSKNVGQPGVSTYRSATVGVVGDGFMAANLTIQNTAGPDAHQAVAFRSDSDRSIIQNCEFLGNQDTLYAHSLRQYYKSCTIQGNVDFIFGNSASVFQDCLVLVAPRQLNPEKGEKNAITAHGRIDPAQTTGFVFRNSVVNGTEAYMKLYYSNPKVHNTFLGRPWKEFSRTVFVGCKLEALITRDGWMPWDGEFALKTLYYGEFENTGSGANVTGRVTWSSRVPAEHAGSYSVENFIQGDQWIGHLSSCG